MSLYAVTIGERTYKVCISGDRVTVDGKDVKARWMPLNQNGLQMLQRGQETYEVFVSNQEADIYQACLQGGQRIITRISSYLGRRTQAGADGKKSGGLSAPMHGLVVDVCVKEGDQVSKGQTLVVLESMKMQMQLKSPRDGKVSKVTAQAGSQVEKGASLVQFEQ